MKILIFGSNGLVGSSLMRCLSKNKNFKRVIGSTRKDTNLFNFEQTYKTIKEIEPNIIINAAAKVGGILANNTKRFEFISENLKINLNLLESIKDFDKIKFINLGSSCIYPLGAPNPIKEDYIMSGKLEPTNSPYAMAKLSAIEMGDALNKQHNINVINLMPTNLYGPNDNFSQNNSHVIPGIISRMHSAKLKNQEFFEIWGSGNPLREFLYVDDLSSAIQFLIEENINEKILNVGSNSEISIKNLAILIKNKIGFKGILKFDKSKPDGNPRKLLDSSLLFNYGWKPKTELDIGIETTYKWYLDYLSKLETPK